MRSNQSSPKYVLRSPGGGSYWTGTAMSEKPEEARVYETKEDAEDARESGQETQGLELAKLFG